MIIVMKPNAPIEERNKIIAGLEAKGFKIDLSTGNQAAILGVVGDTSTLNPHDIMVNDWIEKVLRVQEPFKRANRAFHPDDSVIDVGGVKIGGRQMQVIAGPCSVETREQIIGVAKSVKMAGAHLMRGGAFKPRTSPYSFQGMGMPGLELLKEAKAETGLPIVTEIMSADVLDKFVEDVDLIVKRIGQDEQTDFAETRVSRYGSGMDHERGIYHGRRQYQCYPVRTGHPHL